jgi:hypothetical protein
MFCAIGLILDGTEGSGSSFYVLRSQSRFGRYRGRRVLFICFSLSVSFSAVPRASGIVFMFCATRDIFGGIEGRLVQFLCFALSKPFSEVKRALPNSFWAVPRVLGHVFMFSAPDLVFGGTEGVGSSFFVLRNQSYFRRYRGRRV